MLGKRFKEAVDVARTQLEFEEGVSLLVVTGDITEAARPKEYAEATAFFEALVSELKLSRRRVIFVPGNHDVSWSDTKKVVLDQHDEEFDDAERDRRIRAIHLDKFTRFVKEFYAKDPQHAKDPHHTKPIGNGAHVHAFHDLGVSVAALNSCERESHLHQGGFLSDAQAQALMEHWHSSHDAGGIKIVAIHHNPVATVPEGVRSWVEFLKGKPGLNKELIDHFAADATGFEGRERLQAVAQDCQVQLVLHGHHHAGDASAWTWKNGVKGQTLVLSSGSWGLTQDKLPEGQSAMMHLLRLDTTKSEARSVFRVYVPTARATGVVQPGTFTLDPTNPNGATIHLSIPAQRQRSDVDVAPSSESVTDPRTSPNAGRKGRPRTAAPSKRVSTPKRTSNGKRGERGRLPSNSLRARESFERVIHPWSVNVWRELDGGQEGIIEITRPAMNDTTTESTGRRFVVHIGRVSSRTPGRVVVNLRTETLRRLLQGTEPALIAVFDDSTECFLYRWADVVLRRGIEAERPTWALTDGVDVPVPVSQTIGTDSLSDIEHNVILHRRGSLLLEPGAFFRYQGRAMAAVDELSQLAARHDIRSVQERLKRLHDMLQHATYMIAVAGPSRAGKSTLLNALIGRQLSPVGTEPTTAVWIVVMTGSTDRATVFMHDGQSTVEGPPDAEFLEEYAAQRMNEDNVKRVQHILVRLRSAALERGVAFIDAPGLRDPSPEIQIVTERALKAAHAIIYVLDVSPARDGGFQVDASTIDEIRKLGGATDKMFLVLNKADRLEAGQTEKVLEHVDKRLTKYGVKSYFGHAPILLSAEAGWQHHLRSRPGTSPLAELETILWRHLLDSNSTGMDRLRLAVTELLRASQEFSTLFSQELRIALTTKKFAESIANCKQRRDELLQACQERRREDIELVRKRLANFRASYLVQLAEQLQCVRINDELPSRDILLSQLRASVRPAVLSIWNDVVQRLTIFSADVGKRIEDALEQVRFVIEAPTVRDAPAELIASLALQPAELCPEAAIWSIFGGLVGLAFGPLGVVFGTVLGGLGGWLAGREKHREKQIARSVKNVAQALDEMLARAESAMMDKIGKFHKQLHDQAVDRIDVFLHDIERRRARGDVVLDHEEKCQITAAREEIDKIATVVARLAEELRHVETPMR